MKSKRIIIGLSVIALLVVGAAFKFQKSQGHPKEAVPQTDAIPDYEVYRQMFHHHVTMKQKADEIEKQGKDGKFLREFYQRRANLSDEEAKALDDIASDCERLVAQQDAKAKAIIDKDLRENGNGKLAPGAKSPDPAAELGTLWDERNAIIIRAKYALLAAFGDGEFTRFEAYLKRDVAPHLVSAPNHPRPSPLGPRHEPKIKTYPSTSSEER